MIGLSPTLRITMGLAALTVSLLLFAQLIGLVPDTRAITLDARKRVCESLAVQLALAAGRSDAQMVQVVLDAFRERNADVRSAAMRRASGEILSQTGDHAHEWGTTAAQRSTDTHVIVPVFAADNSWGGVEVRFDPAGGTGLLDRVRNSFWGLLLFLCGGTLIAFYLALRWALRELDPRGTIPKRVKAALDVLSEGVMILDDKAQIVLANSAFAQRAGMDADRLLGFRASELPWRDVSGESRPDKFPWDRTLRGEGAQTHVMLRLTDAHNGGQRVLATNSTPVTDGSGRQRGVLVTLDDVTQLEKHNRDLRDAVERLRDSEQEIKRKNRALHHLANHDPLTGCMNRRAFFGGFDAIFRSARDDRGAVSCLMVDIDLFKSVNDAHGHDVGDQVIQWVADRLRARLGANDLLCRFGGEEFCLALPGRGIVQASALARTLRADIEEQSQREFGGRLAITISIGVSAQTNTARTPAELLNQADHALLAAKRAGRNRVVAWSADIGIAPPAPAARLRDERTVSDVTPLSVAQSLTGPRVLTGAPGRVAFTAAIGAAMDAARARGKRIAVFSLVPNQLRRVRDTYGEKAGEAMLVEIGDRLRDALRNSDPIARFDRPEESPVVSLLGGDEYGVLLRDLERDDAARDVLQRVFAALSTPTDCDGHVVELDVTVGIAALQDADDTPDAVLRRAAATRHEAHERNGPHRYQFYSPHLKASSSRREQLARGLRRALEADELTLHYQPQLEIASGELRSWEALLRWCDPQLGQISPDEFIPIAEESDLINPLSHWVLRTACEHAMARDGEPGHIAVNLSAAQLHRVDVVDMVREVLAATGLPARNLELEITESAIMQDRNVASRTLMELKQLGVRLAIDDFGTGYSSLSYIRDLPVDTVKIDRHFLTDVPHVNARATELYRSIVEMARRLGLYVVSEGVETPAQRDFVRATGCDAIQGFLLSPALAPILVWHFDIDMRTRAHAAAG